MSDPLPELFRRYPGTRDRVPWASIGSFPTPIEPLSDLDGSGRAWVKRDDLSAEPYGGNKVRKLEFLVADARTRGCRRLVTTGAAGSHHAFATALYGRRLGLDVSLVLFPQTLTPHVREVLLMDRGVGAELRWVPRMEAVPLGMLVARWVHRRSRPRMIPPGGSDPVGTLGYVSAGLELAAQIEAGEMPRPDRVHVAAGTLGTLAGIALGLRLAGMECRVVGHRIASPVVTSTRALRRLLKRTAALLAGAGVAVDPDRAIASTELRHDQVGEGYGRPTAAGEAASRRLAALGLVTDPTYTAKAGAGFLAALEREEGVHLFWHTLSAHEPMDLAEGVGPADLPRRFRHYLGG